MAIQLWQQILLSDPKNTESLAGLARDLKLIGSDKATDALNRLRKVSPNNPDIPKIQALASTRAESAQLSKAGELARQGKVEDAMRIYRQLYGDHPPDGDIALAYYQTLYGTAKAYSSRKPLKPPCARSCPRATPAIRASRYRARHHAHLRRRRTRAEGIRILQGAPQR